LLISFQLTSKITTREKQSSSYIKGDLAQLSTEKEAKIAKYAKESHSKWRKSQKQSARSKAEPSVDIPTNGHARPDSEDTEAFSPVKADNTEDQIGDVGDDQEDADIVSDVEDGDDEGINTPSDADSQISLITPNSPVKSANVPNSASPPPPPPPPQTTLESNEAAVL